MTARVLIVCTGNICRSPMAEGLLRAGAKSAGLDLVVASAGTVDSGASADEHAVAVMADRGIDISGHRSHRMTGVDIAASDLILGMAREHVVAVAGIMPDAFPQTFTLKDFVTRGLDVGPKPTHCTLDAWLDVLHEGRVHSDMLRADDTTDIADPLGKGRRAFEKTAAEIDELVWAAVDLLAGYTPKD